ncbi:hypothetical protein J2Z35_000838 [Acetoanaerobium pronyense]|uniref:VWFA domain-containing protein n=1 Tax=Acetoanaerobium pronyense TaxID=1482736 RepID=A0ABS4KIU0_9FIRM|nr:hypothetical protein [Acetoanaerobium pronyense]MBP2027046.1 hypothetical protein [Acetoanaerobium pronyense]
MNSLNDKLKIRNSNIFWTVSQEYGINPNKKYITNIRSKRNYIFESILSGGIHKYFDVSLIDNNLENIKKTTKTPEIFSEILFLLIEESVFFRLESEWIGIRDIRLNHYKKEAAWFDYHPPKDVLSELRSVYYIKKLNKFPKTSNEILVLLDEILKFEKNTTTKDIINKTFVILKRFFHFDSSFLEEKLKPHLEEKIEKEPIKKEKEKPKAHSKLDLNEVDQEEYVSAEYNPNESVLNPKQGYDGDFSLKEVDIDIKEYSSMKHKIESKFGKGIISESELSRLEKNICQDIHDGCRLHLTDGEFSTELEKSYRLSYLKNQRTQNLEEFEYHENIYRRNIVKLREIIQRSILANTDTGKYKANRGSFIASSAWKSVYLNDFKVFSRDSKDEIGNFVVDIFLDASGSQTERQGKVAAQGFIISEALTLSHIPVRVTGFNNFLDFTILRQYRDYDDPIIKNSSIFDFHTSGTNRDGLAIRAVVDSLSKRSEENKILIILSDGRPNDIRITKTTASSIKGELDYKGYKAIKDTGFEVRKARQKGIAVLGIYTGEENDLEAEKLIFGRDFAYIKNIDRFSELVGFYLKKHIENMLDP